MANGNLRSFWQQLLCMFSLTIHFSAVRDKEKLVFIDSIQRFDVAAQNYAPTYGTSADSPIRHHRSR
jgi:hypothetical protein